MIGHNQLLLLHNVNKSVILSHFVHLKLGHGFHAVLKVCSDYDDIASLTLTH